MSNTYKIDKNDISKYITNTKNTYKIIIKVYIFFQSDEQNTYNYIYSEHISEQTKITRHFQSILEKRDQLGTTLDHSTHLGAAAIHSNFV